MATPWGNPGGHGRPRRKFCARRTAMGYLSCAPEWRFLATQGEVVIGDAGRLMFSGSRNHGKPHNRWMVRPTKYVGRGRRVGLLGTSLLTNQRLTNRQGALPADMNRHRWRRLRSTTIKGGTSTHTQHPHTPPHHTPKKKKDKKYPTPPGGWGWGGPTTAMDAYTTHFLPPLIWGLPAGDGARVYAHNAPPVIPRRPLSTTLHASHSDEEEYHVRATRRVNQQLGGVLFASK